MTDFNKIFLDTAPFIYFLDSDINFGEKVRNIFSSILAKDKQMASSVISCAEYLVYPYRKNNISRINAFWKFVSDCDIELCSITSDIAVKSAQIRAEYKHFKQMDSLQLAAACLQGCDLFLTNDKQLKQFQEIDCITIEEWQT